MRLSERLSRLWPLLLLLLLGSMLTPAWAIQVSALLDRARIGDGETVILILHAAGNVDGVQPDLAPLAADFEILGTGTSTQVRIINGQRNDSTQWRVTLMPKRTGTLTLPALRVGEASTAPLSLEVSDSAPAATADMPREVWVEMEVTGGSDPYVQAQVPLTVRVLTARPIREGSLSEPQVAAALIEKLGPDRRYSATRDGAEYHVVERRYAVFPQQSGPLTLPPVVFRGTLAAPPRPRDPAGTGSPLQRFFDNDPFFDDSIVQRFFDDSVFGRAAEAVRPVTARGEAITLNVQPAPVAGSDWLPARAVMVTDSWTSAPPSLRVGEPARRTLTLTVQGLTGAQIPEIRLPEVADLSIYAEPAALESRTDGEQVIGVSSRSFTMIPARAGTLALPPYRVTWWDTEARERQVVELPAWTLNVAPGVGVAPPAPAPATRSDGWVDEPEATVAPTVSAVDTARAGRLGWFWMPIALAILVGGALYHWRRGAKAKDSAPVATPDQAERERLKAACLDACSEQDPRRAARTLLAWARAEWPEESVTSLTAIAARLQHGAEAVLELHGQLFREATAGWRGDTLARALANGLPRRVRPASGRREAAALDPLYPA
ncbi:MAG: BatD family protein [Thiotrichales bacterium]